MLVPDRLAVKVTVKVFGAAATTLRINSLDGSLMIEWGVTVRYNSFINQ
jgi:hypothetical protein